MVKYTIQKEHFKKKEGGITAAIYIGLKKLNADYGIKGRAAFHKATLSYYFLDNAQE